MSSQKDLDDLFEWSSKTRPKPKEREKPNGDPYPSPDTPIPEASLNKAARPSMKIFIPLLVFAVGMAFLESAVVVYLREIWKLTDIFPVEDIFDQAQNIRTLKVEFAREAATLVMLVSISFALGRNAWQRVAYFLFLFGVWDIFYYAWLRVMIDWPQSLLSWDVLFFIPVTLVSPVYAPIAVSSAMIFCGIMIIHAERKRVTLKSTRRFWIMEALAFGLVYASFILETPEVNAGALESELEYPWLMLLLGLTIGLTAFLFLVQNCFKRRRLDFDLYVSRKI
jgi:hypothetical protein